MKKLYIGIDPSFTDTAIVAIDGDGVVIHELHVTSKPNKNESSAARIVEYSSRLQKLFEHIFPNTGDYPYDISVAIEEPMGFHAGNGAKMGQVYAAASIAIFYGLGPFEDIGVIKPTTLKKFITGKGNAKKSTIIKEVYKRWGFNTDNDNTADAYGIARWLIYIDQTD